MTSKKERKKKHQELSIGGKKNTGCDVDMGRLDNHLVGRWVITSCHQFPTVQEPAIQTSTGFFFFSFFFFFPFFDVLFNQSEGCVPRWGRMQDSNRHTLLCNPAPLLSRIKG